MQFSIFGALGALPIEWDLIGETWCRGLDYDHYCKFCNDFYVEPLDKGLFDVVFDACQEQYVHDNGVYVDVDDPYEECENVFEYVF